MLKKTNRVIALALTGLLSISGLPASALAEPVIITRAGKGADATETTDVVEAVTETTVETPINTTAETTPVEAPHADVLVHRVDEPAWNADESFADALAKAQSEAQAAEASAKEADAKPRKIIRRRGSTDAETAGKAESEAALNGLRVGIVGEGLGVRYRLREVEGWQEAWSSDGAICPADALVTGLAIELTGEAASFYDLWVCLRHSDGQTGSWGIWVLTREDVTIEAPDGVYITDVAVRLLPKPSTVPEPMGETTVEQSAVADAATVADEATTTDEYKATDADATDRVAIVAEEATTETSETPEATDKAESAAPVALTAAAEQVPDVPLVAAASDVSWARLFGDTRYDTMMAISSTGFSSNDTAVLTTGQSFPDALAASGLAGALGCPILLTDPEYLSWQAESEIERLGVTHVIIVGGTGAVSSDAQAELEGLGIECERISGADRMATSVAVFNRLTEATGSPTAAIVASGQGFADALSISPYAYATNTPILLTDASGHLTDAEFEALSSSAVQEVIIVGGAAAVSDEVEDQLAYFGTTRLSGADRYATSAKIAEFEQSAGLDWGIAYVCTGKTFPDALAGGALAGSTGSILVIADSLSHPTIELMRAHAAEMDHGVIFGGKNAFPYDDPLAVEGSGQEQGQEGGQTGGKVGYQNPAGFYQVSSDNVTITSAATAPFDYITPSRIAPDASREDCVAAFLERAEEYIGTPYVWDYACAPGVGVDCIGLVYQCAYACGMDLGGGTGDTDFNPWAHYITGNSGWHSHDANNFWDYGLAMHVSLDARQPGDLISYPGHIAIYLGDDQIIHAYTTATGVIYDDMWSPGTPRGCIRLFQ